MPPATATAITVCKGRLAYLQQSLPTWLAIPHLNVIIVDAECPDRPAANLPPDLLASPRLRILPHPNHPTLRLNAARNFGAAAATTPLLFFIDTDVCLDPRISSILQSATSSPTTYHHALPIGPGIGGTCIIPRQLFDLVGGFDDVYQGWGWEDNDLYHMLALLRITPQTFPADYLRHLDHPDDLRTRFYSEKDRTRSTLANRLYCHTKSQLMRLLQRQLPRPEREHLYSLVQASTTTALNTGLPQDLTLALPPFSESACTLSPRLTITIQPPAPVQS